MMHARFFTKGDRDVWNAHNSAARNGHFMFDRGFMEYHADRFSDASVLVHDGSDVIAAFPANVRGEAAYSHQGLTFGGLILAERANTARVLAILGEVVRLFQVSGVTRILYKAVPAIYHQRPSQEDLYALTRLGAVIVRRDVTTTIDLGNRGPVSTRRIRGIKKAGARGLRVGASEQWAGYWKVLAETLRSRHDVAPTHSEEEIVRLAGRFPDNIKLFTAEEAGSIQAGLVIFETETVAHAQYLAATPDGRSLGALDLVIEHTIEFYRSRKRFFDFGISTVDGGRVLNEGLIKQKEEFGGSAVVHDVYELDIARALHISREDEAAS